jgi:hypothetical protein
MSEPTQETFLRDVAQHKMKIVRNEGVSRHVIFAKPESYNMRFEFITWPGHLCYTGDMGTFVFRRLEDMFEFFRYEYGSDGKLRINLQYWAEKLEATDRCDGERRWSPEKFRSVIEHYLENDGDQVPEGLREAVEEEIYTCLDDGEHEAYRAANDFRYKGFQFNDLWDHDFREYTYRFIWCCYALAWGIEQYDKAQEKSTQMAG